MLAFSLGIHDALERVKAEMRPGEHLFAFLDDVYMLAQPDRIRFLYNLLAAALAEQCGIHLNAGKTRTWNAAGVRPQGTSDLGDDVWSESGINILGMPIGSDDCVRSLTHRRIASEQKLLNALQRIPDLQSAWQVLLQSATPRANHLLRTIPPSQVQEYASMHDAAKWQALQDLLGLSKEDKALEVSKPTSASRWSRLAIG